MYKEVSLNSLMGNVVKSSFCKDLIPMSYARSFTRNSKGEGTGMGLFFELKTLNLMTLAWWDLEEKTKFFLPSPNSTFAAL